METLAVAEATSNDPLPEVLSATLDIVRPGTNAIVISTRSVTLTNTDRFALLWRNPRQRAWLNRLQCIDVSRPELADYFVPIS